jgi:hypothetical protein
MSDVVDLTLLSTLVQGIDRELRLLRLQLDQVVSMTPRLAALEQSFHGLITEVARGFEQMQQQAARQDKRVDAVDAQLAALQAGTGREYRPHPPGTERWAAQIAPRM